MIFELGDNLSDNTVTRAPLSHTWTLLPAVKNSQVLVI